jgi:hypothetical protein
MMPVILPSLPAYLNIAAVVALLQVDLLLFLTGKRYLRWMSVAAVALVGSMVGAAGGAALVPGTSWAIIAAGLVGGALLGYYARPVGLGLVLAYIGGTVATSFASYPAVEYIVAVDLFVYGLLLTDLAPTLVTSLLASSIMLLAVLWTGAPAPAAFVLASATGGAKLMASLLPARFALKSRETIFAHRI